MIDHYNIDTNRVYLEGYSGGGETASQALGMNPSLYTAVLLASSQFDGDIANVVKARTPVYMAIGESDEYYGSSPFRRAYQQFVSEYQSLGLSDDEINQLVRLDVKDADYFRNGGVTNQHGGGALLFAGDEEIMGWLFNHKRV